MDLDKARAFLKANHRSVLATRRRDGAPQMSPVVHAVDDDGRICISSRETAIKAANIRRDPRVSLLAINDQFFGEWVQIDGTATIVSLPEAMDVLVFYYRQVSGEHPDWDDYRAAMVRDQRVLIKLSLTRAGPDVSG